MNESVLAQWLWDMNIYPMEDHRISFPSFMAVFWRSNNTLQKKIFSYTIVFITVLEETLTEVCILGKGITLTKIKSSFRGWARLVMCPPSGSFLSVPWSMKAKEPDWWLPFSSHPDSIKCSLVTSKGVSFSPSLGTEKNLSSQAK